MQKERVIREDGRYVLLYAFGKSAGQVVESCERQNGIETPQTAAQTPQRPTVKEAK